MARLTKYSQDSIKEEDKIANHLQDAFDRIKTLEEGGGGDGRPTSIKSADETITVSQTGYNADLAVNTGLIATKSDINTVEAKLDLKEDIANKSNEIDNSLVLYPNNNAVKVIYDELKNAVQAVADDLPYIVQGQGTSTSDVISQAGFTNEIKLLWAAVNAITGGDPIEFPDVITEAEVEALIRNITGLLEELNTADKITLVGAINELLAKIENNITSITGLQTALSGKANTSDVVLLTGNQTVEGIKTFSSNPISTAAQSTAVNALLRYDQAVRLSGNQTIDGTKTFSVNPRSSATQDTNAAALTRYDAVVNLTAAQTIGGVKTFSSATVHNATPTSGTTTSGNLPPTANNHLTRKDYVDTQVATRVDLTTNQTVAGIKTFSSIPVAPATNPTTDNQLTRKGYVDTQVATKANASDLTTTNTNLTNLTTRVTTAENNITNKANVNAVVDLTTNQTVGGIKTFSSIPVAPATNPTTDNQLTRKGYVDAEIAKIKSIVIGLFIAQGVLVSGNPNGNIEIYENNNGVNGALVETIARHDWQRMAFYAPEIAICRDYVMWSWTGVGVPLNFAKCTEIGNMSINQCTQFNNPVLFPNLKTVGFSFMWRFLVFNHSIFLPKLEVINYSFLNGLDAIGDNLANSPPVIAIGGKNLLTTANSSNFLSISVPPTSIRHIKVRFLDVQNITALDTGTTKAFRFRNTDNLIHNMVDIELPNGSAAVNVPNRTWAGHTFRSVTLF